MTKRTRLCLMAALISLLVACGGGGGGDSAAGVEPGPPPAGQPVPPPPIEPAPPPTPYAEAEKLLAFITSVTIPEDGQPVVEWQLSDGNNVAITDLGANNVRFTLAKLEASTLGNLTGSWQSYINSIEQPGVGPGTESKLQATYERNAGEFTNNGDGSYRYRMALNVNDLPADIVAQAQSEGLNLSYQPDRTHRVAMQFDGSQDAANPHYDWVPATGVTDGVFSMDIAATTNCNRCHDPLAIHGGNRQQLEYCVTCHNPGSTDANSGNTVDFKVMVHKIHRGANLPSVEAGESYAIYGFRNSLHDYSNLHLPMDIRNCSNCHAGSVSGTGNDELTLTSQGDNWTQYASRAVCGSCHDNLDFASHAGGQPDDSNCNTCHSEEGPVGSISDSHRILTAAASERFVAEVLGVDNSSPGEVPTVSFRISNPQSGEDYDLFNDPEFNGASLSMRMAWDTGDYHNTGNGADDSSSVRARILSGAVANGDGSYRISMPIAIPDGSEAPGIAASGSGAAIVEGRVSAVIEEGGDPQRVPLTNAHAFFSIDEPNGAPVARRQSVDLDKCLDCHVTLSLHGSNRTDSIDSCVTCHNPRNTDREVREIAANPPTDGKDEQSLHFKVLIHGIHAAAILEQPLQVVGFRGFSTHVYDEEQVHFPGDLANCTACHTEDGYTLPLPSSVLGTTVDTGENHQDPTDDTVVTPVAAACSSCHDDVEALAHMESNGASFATTQAAIDDFDVVEQCSVCHGSGRDFDVQIKHNIHEKPLP